MLRSATAADQGCQGHPRVAMSGEQVIAEDVAVAAATSSQTPVGEETIALFPTYAALCAPQKVDRVRELLRCARDAQARSISAHGPRAQVTDGESRCRHDIRDDF